MTHEPGVGKRGRSVSEEGGGWQVVSAELVIAGNKPTGSRGLSPSLSVSAPPLWGAQPRAGREGNKG